MGKILLALFAVFAVYAFARMAWSGRIDFGKDKVVDRRNEPRGFWAVWLIGVCLFSLAFSCWSGLASFCYR